MAECYFKCDNQDLNLSEAGPERIKKIIESSKLRSDTIHDELQNQLDKNPELTIACHRTCVSTYTSKVHIQRHLKRHGSEVSASSTGPSPIKRTRRSEVSQFDFKEHCLFCGDICLIDKPKKNPSRWRPAFLCRTADRSEVGQESFKTLILRTCKERNDEWSRHVQVRVQSAVSDLHAADARYHDDCRKSFMRSRSDKSKKTPVSTEKKDTAFDAVSNTIKSDKNRVWTSVDIFTLYKENNGSKLSRRRLTESIIDAFEGDLVMFSSPGLANVLLFRNRAAEVLRLVDDEEDDISCDKLAKQIMKESKTIVPDKKLYQTRIDAGTVAEATTPTFMKLLSLLSTKLSSTLTAGMLGNMITSCLTNRPTPLQIALGVLVREKSLIETLYDFGVTCSYDEVLRFKSSAAKAASLDMTKGPIWNSEAGLIQAVADNFDANISSQNGLQSTHSLALILTQLQHNVPESEETIPRIKKAEVQSKIHSDIEIEYYNGPKKTNMPDKEAKRQILPLKILARQRLSERRACDIDMAFIQSVTSKEPCPEFGGFNTKMAREQGHALQPASKVMYTPLLDMTPSDPDTMMTAMVQAQKLTNETGQVYTVFTADQQLYRVMVNVMWANPETFANFIPRLGGMHMLMSFVGCVGSLMANSGLEEIMKSAFGGVPRMLSGKKFPQNVRALRLVVEELLRDKLDGIEDMNGLKYMLEDKASHNNTTKLWVDCLIRPVFIMMMFVRAEREADWPLHLCAVDAMMPYFFAAGHMNYARYGLYYLRSMERLPADLLDKFLKGEHVMRHQAGLWNGLWSDMFIETTFMRYGHGPGGLIGITLNESAMKRWALSLHLCSRLVKDVADLREADSDRSVLVHKEEMKSRIEADTKDREKLREKLKTCIDPLNMDGQPQGFINVVTGKISTGANLDLVLAHGNKMMEDFESGWPESFHNTIASRVVTMAVSKKTIKVGAGKTFDTKLIFSRVMGLMASREIDLASVFNHELAPIPTSMFEDSGDMRITKTKSVLKRKLQVEKSTRTASKPDAIVIDGCAILWTIHWPTHGTVQDYVNHFCGHVLNKLSDANVYLVFDRYFDYSIKSITRTARAGQEVRQKHQLSLSTPLPSQQVTLTVTSNKVQLIDFICTHVVDKAKMIPQTDERHTHSLVVTGSDPTPVEVRLGVTVARSDMKTSHEEADTIIPQQVVAIANQGAKCINVICDDTDVFILLLHFYNLCKLKCSLFMEGTSEQRTTVDIGATVTKHQTVVPYLLAAHAMSGCDTIAYCWGIGKGSVLKTLSKGFQLEKLGELNEPLPDIIKEATAFMGECYGSKVKTSLSDIRFDVWRSKTGKRRLTKTPQLKALPPTTEAFTENVKRAHVQTFIWKSSLDQEPVVLDPSIFGWSKDEGSRSLVPITTPDSVAPAPDEILKMICCGCASEQPCSAAKCGCYTAQLACTVFCKCHQTNNCCNNWTHLATDVASDDDGDDTDEND